MSYEIKNIRKQTYMIENRLEFSSKSNNFLIKGLRRKEDFVFNTKVEKYHYKVTLPQEFALEYFDHMKSVLISSEDKLVLSDNETEKFSDYSRQKRSVDSLKESSSKGSSLSSNFTQAKLI